MEEVRQLMLFANREQDNLTHKEKVLRKTVGSLVGAQIL